MATILITGAAGFMGSHLSEAMIKNGHQVVGIDNFDAYYPRPLKEHNLRDVLQCDAFTLIEGDIRNTGLMDELVRTHRPEVILHWAAKAGVRPSIEKPADYASVNVEGTAAVLQAASQFPATKIIFASSSSIYGAANPLPFVEQADVSRPISPYAATKIACEALCHSFHHLYGLPIICLRLFTVYGPRQRPDLAINKFARLISEDQPIPLFGDGCSTRDYTYVDDVVDAVSRAVSADFKFEIVNIGSGNPISLADLVTELQNAMGSEATIDWQPDQPGDVPHTHADITRANQILGWQPQMTIAEGLKRFTQWYKKNVNSGKTGDDKGVIAPNEKHKH